MCVVIFCVIIASTEYVDFFIFFFCISTEVNRKEFFF